MKNLLIFLMVFLFLGTTAFAAETIVEPYQISISADAGKPYDTVTFEIETDRSPVKAKITNIRLSVNGVWQDVPKKAYVDLESPLLNHAQIRTEYVDGGSRWLYLYFDVAQENEPGIITIKTVQLAYHQGVFVYRLITTPVNESQSKEEKLNL